MINRGRVPTWFGFQYGQQSIAIGRAGIGKVCVCVMLAVIVISV